MKNFEVTFIVDPVLSGDEIKATAQVYQELLKNEGCSIVHIDEMGLRQLAYPINKRSSGVYYCIEFSGETGSVISKMELAFRRDERIMRFLTVSLDKAGVKYNDDKRKGLIGKVQKKVKAKKEDGAPRAEAPAREEAYTTPSAPISSVAAAPVVAAPVAVHEEE
jgi:small subunit ribosomal protein S6